MLGLRILTRTIFNHGGLECPNYLMGKGLWGYVTGEDTEPELPLEGATPDDLKAWKT